MKEEFYEFQIGDEVASKVNGIYRGTYIVEGMTKTMLHVVTTEIVSEPHAHFDGHFHYKSRKSIFRLIKKASE